MSFRRSQPFQETFQSSILSQNGQRFALDRSLVKGVKEQDVGKIISTGQQGILPIETIRCDEKTQFEKIIIEMKTKYDQCKTQTTIIQDKISKMKSNIEKLKNEQQQYQKTISQKKKSYNSTSQKLKQMTGLAQSTIYKKDVYEQLKTCLKKDILILKKRYFDLDVAKMRDSTKLRSLQNQAANKKTLGISCRKMVTNLEQTVINKKCQRTSKINSVYEVLNKKQQINEKKSQRDQQMQQTMISAINDRSKQQKSWLKIYRVNMFLKQILKSKMLQVMSTYSEVESSFQLIKLNTSIKDSNQLVHRYLNRQKIYGQLLSSISNKQQKLEQTKIQKSKLEMQNQNLEYKAAQISDQFTKSSIEFDGSGKELQTFNEKLLKIERQKKQIYHWGIKTLVNFGQVEKNLTFSQKQALRESLFDQFDKDKINIIFKEALQVLKQNSVDIAKPETEQKIDEIFSQSPMKQKTLTEEMSQRNLRIKTTMQTMQNTYDQLEQQDLAYDQVAELDLLKHHRRAVKKGEYMHRKFRIKTKPN